MRLTMSQGTAGIGPVAGLPVAHPLDERAPTPGQPARRTLQRCFSWIFVGGVHVMDLSTLACRERASQSTYAPPHVEGVTDQVASGVAPMFRGNMTP